jgi:pimeloyl-ACP methyl ester carboxylesterase
MTSLDRADVAPLEFVDLGGYRMAYRQWGDTAAPDAVVLVHGITSSSLSWVHVGPRLGEHGRAIAVDLKGHGDSGRPATGYRLEDQADEVAALVRSLGLRSLSLVGHSWGGGISLVLAARNDLPIRRVVLEDPAISVGSAPPEQRQQVVEMYTSSVGLSPAEADARVRANVAPGWTEADIAGKIDASVKGSPSSVRAVFEENGPWNVAERLAELRVPTLLVRAEVANGGIVGEATVALAQRNPQIEVVTVPGADHNIHRGQFDTFMAHVEPFLASE